jgi:hypothetical protein
MSESPLAELAAALHWRVIAVLIGYFDESGTHDEARVAAIAGYVGTTDEWARVETSWQAVLDQFAHKGLKTFHMVECMGQSGECAGLEKFELRYLLMQLTDLLESADLKAVWSAVDVPDWHAATTSEFRLAFPKPYDFCYSAVLSEVEAWARQHEGEDRVALVFAVQDEYRKRAKLTFDAWENFREHHNFYATLTHAYPWQYPGLQATDMLAYQTNLEWRGIQQQGPRLENNFGYDPLLTKITSRNGMGGGGLYDARALTSTVKSFARILSSSEERPP